MTIVQPGCPKCGGRLTKTGKRFFCPNCNRMYSSKAIMKMLVLSSVEVADP